MNFNHSHNIVARKVKFDFNNIAKHWIADDTLATHLLNVAHIVLPAGEFWFCRVFNKALPLVEEEKLRADVKGFIHQEAIHGRTHEQARVYFEQNGIHLQALTKNVHYFFEVLLGENPLGFPVLKKIVSDQRWLNLRLGLIAGIEHYTGVVGQWSLDNTSLDDDDPTMVRLFRWHLAEEVEHRNVAFDLFKTMYTSDLRFQIAKNGSLLIALPLLLAIWMHSTKKILEQDADSGKFADMGVLRLLLEVQKTSRKNDHLPSVTHLLGSTLRWFHPKFHPETEGNTEQALEYLSTTKFI